MIISKRNLINSLIILLFLTGCREKLNYDDNKLDQADIVIQNDNVLYKGKILEFDKIFTDWDKQIEKSRVLAYEESEAYDYIYDNLGFSISTVPYDDSQDWSKTKVRALYIYFRNLDSQIGRIGELTYGNSISYYNIKPQDWLDSKEWLKGKKELPLEDKKSIEYLNSQSGKKSDFAFPYKTHKKPIFIDGAKIDSTMTIADINKRRVAKGLEPFHYYPMVGGVNSMGRADEDTSGKYTGIYKTEFGNKIRYELTLQNIKNQVVYIKVRKFSPNEMKTYREYLKNKNE